jgi:hypothetical protein
MALGGGVGRRLGIATSLSRPWQRSFLELGWGGIFGIWWVHPPMLIAARHSFSQPFICSFD